MYVKLFFSGRRRRAIYNLVEHAVSLAKSGRYFFFAMALQCLPLSIEAAPDVRAQVRTEFYDGGSNCVTGAWDESNLGIAPVTTCGRQVSNGGMNSTAESGAGSGVTRSGFTGKREAVNHKRSGGDCAHKGDECRNNLSIYVVLAILYSIYLWWVLLLNSGSSDALGGMLISYAKKRRPNVGNER